MTDSPSDADPRSFQLTIQQNLQEIAAQMGQPIDAATAKQLYQEAVDLLGLIAYEPLTLARVAGTLLVYQMQPIEAEEVKWFKDQVQQCEDAEAVEELMESLYRTDAL